eukprot:scaffold3474_cov148-Skeletonema_menzelii.AAC.1
MSGFGQSTFGGGNVGFGGGQFPPTTPSNHTNPSGGGFSTSSTPLAFGQQQPSPAFGQPFGSSSSTAAATNPFSNGGGFGTPAPLIAATAPTGFGTTTTTAASTATPFGSSSTTTATTTTGGFGNQSSSGFGSGGSGFGSAVAPTTTTTPLAFGSSSTVATSQPATTITTAAPTSSFFGTGSTIAASSSSVFGNTAATTTGAMAFGGSSGNNTGSGTTAFGSSSTAFGGSTPSHTTTTTGAAAGGGGFGSSTGTTIAGGGFGSSTGTNVAGGFGSSAGTTTTGGFGSSSITSSTGGGTNLSANAAPFTPSAPSNTTSTGGFGSSNTGGGFGGGFGGGGFGSVASGDKTTTANDNSGFGGESSSSSFGGGFGGQTAAGTTATTSTSSAFGGGGFGMSATSTPSTSAFGNNKDSNASETNEAVSSSFPFGSRIPRKEKATPQTAGGGDASKSSSSDGDAQLAALRAKIQEKKQRLLDKKKMQQQQQSNSAGSGMSPPRTAPDSDRNKELAAKNALRFATQQENKALSSLLPTDLQGHAQASESNDDDRSAPFGGDVGNVNDDVDDDDDLAHRNVNNAKSLIGICTSMCPDEELLRREKEGDIQLLEITDPGGLHPAHWTLRDTAVKRFRRSAADFKLDIPELVRPPEVLERVCGYLEEWVMERDRQGPDKRWAQAATTTSDTPPPLDVYQFIWDRTRMIRKDFILQNYIGTGGKCDARAVRCHERIARWHAMCEHQLSHIPDFVKHQSQQNIAELGQTMKTLNLYYDDALGRALTEPASSGGSDSQGCVSDIVMGKSPIDFDGNALSNDAQAADVTQRIIGKNGAGSPSRGTAEPEMRGLYILLTMNNEGGMEVLKYSGRLCTQRPDIFYSKPVQLALTIFRAKKDHNYAKFFRLLRCPSTPYLFSCIMFKYVENMRKETLLMMSKVYGAKNKTGEAFYDSYPLEKLVNLLCYEDESEAKEACRHYGITVEGDQVLWRHSKFREPRDPDKGLIISLKPRKMVRTIESKLSGATRLSVCRGGVSGQGATLSSAPANVDAEAMLKERQKAQEEMKQKLAEAKAKEEAERLKQEEIKKEKVRQERLAAKKRAKEEAARRAEQERVRQEQLERERLEQQRQEQERIKAEEKARREAAERAERLRLEKEAREKKEREIAEARRLAEEERKRKLAEEERIRRLEEEKRRREEEERRRIAREAEMRRKAEEERIRKAKEEEERKIEMAWRQKVENARKLLICRLLRKQMRRYDSLQKSRNSLSRLDPTCTQYPTSDVELCRDLFHSAPTEVVARRIGSCDELENQVYRLATSPRHPMDLSQLVANCMPLFLSHQAKASYPSVVRKNKVKLFKLAILLPERLPQFSQLYDTLRMWVESHLDLGEVSSAVCSSRSCQIDARAVAVISNDDDSNCEDCDAALVLLPSFTDETVSVVFSEKAQELLGQNVPRMVLVLDVDDDLSHRNAPSTERWLDTLLGESSGGAGLQREGVAAPNLCDFDLAFQKCCQVLVQSHISTTTSNVDNEDNISTDPSLVRVPLSDVGFLCLHQFIRNLEENGFFNNAGPNCHDNLFDMCRNALSSLSHELSCAYEELHQQWQHWPAQEFCVSDRVECFFGEDKDLPANWYESTCDVGSELKRFFQHLLERSTLTLFVESIVGSLSDSLQQDLLIMLDNGEISSCFSTIVTMVVSGEINLVSDGQSILYLPVTKLFSVIEHAAAYRVPEPVDQDVGIPDYLLYGCLSVDDDLEEKENSTVLTKNDKIIKGEKRTRTPAKNEDNTISKRSRVRKDNIDPNLRLLQDHEQGSSPKKLKCARLNDGAKIDTEAERSSKSFTSYLEALLGGDVPL